MRQSDSSHLDMQRASRAMTTSHSLGLWGYTSTSNPGLQNLYCTAYSYKAILVWVFFIAVIYASLFHCHCWLALLGRNNISFWMQSLPCRIAPKQPLMFIAFINLTVWRQYWWYLYNSFIPPSYWDTTTLLSPLPHVLGTVKIEQCNTMHPKYLWNE